MAEKDERNVIEVDLPKGLVQAGKLLMTMVRAGRELIEEYPVWAAFTILPSMVSGVSSISRGESLDKVLSESAALFGVGFIFGFTADAAVKIGNGLWRGVSRFARGEVDGKSTVWEIFGKDSDIFKQN